MKVNAVPVGDAEKPKAFIHWVSSPIDIEVKGHFSSCKIYDNGSNVQRQRLSFTFSEGQTGFDRLSSKITQKKFCAYTFFEMCNL